jgi:hypothetical protein
MSLHGLLTVIAFYTRTCFGHYFCHHQVVPCSWHVRNTLEVVYVYVEIDMEVSLCPSFIIKS